MRGRRTELDDLDAAALAAGRGAEVGSDMALALSLWKAVSDRYAEMWATWDGGRVLDAQRQQVTALVLVAASTASGSRCPRRAGSPTPSPASCAPGSR